MFEFGFGFDRSAWTTRGKVCMMEMWIRYNGRYGTRSKTMAIGLKPLCLGLNGRWILPRKSAEGHYSDV